MAGDEQASDESAVLLMVRSTMAGTIMLVFVLGSIGFQLAAVLDLARGPVQSNHHFLHWWVSPSQGWFVFRAGCHALVIFALVMIEMPESLREDAKVGLDNVSSLFLVLLSFLYAVLVLVCLFAATDLQAAHDHLTGPSQCFGVGPYGVTRLTPGGLTASDALYFAIGNLTTAGTGLVAPLSSGCRALVAWQTAIGAVVILFGAGAVASILIQRDARVPDEMRSSSDGGDSQAE
jgi:hypothetical protein